MIGSSSELAKERCENCVFVDRGYDEYSHEVHSVSSGCPLYKNLSLYEQVNGRFHAIEWGTGLTGCRFFVEDLQYKKHMEETEIFLKELHDKRKIMADKPQEMELTQEQAITLYETEWWKDVMNDYTAREIPKDCPLDDDAL